jgi:hypothetical protein
MKYLRNIYITFSFKFLLINRYIVCHLFLLFPDQELEGKNDIYVPDQEDFLEINQPETRIACGSHVCKWIGSK